MALSSRLLQGIGTAVGVLVGGLLLLQMWPSDEERSAKLRKDFPEPGQYYSEAQRQNAMFMEILREAAMSDENLARKPNAWKK